MNWLGYAALVLFWVHLALLPWVGLAFSLVLDFARGLLGACWCLGDFYFFWSTKVVAWSWCCGHLVIGISCLWRYIPEIDEDDEICETLPMSRFSLCLGFAWKVRWWWCLSCVGATLFRPH